jgi:hypothetical protein
VCVAPSMGPSSPRTATLGDGRLFDRRARTGRLTRSGSPWLSPARRMMIADGFGSACHGCTPKTTSGRDHGDSPNSRRTPLTGTGRIAVPDPTPTAPGPYAGRRLTRRVGVVPDHGRTVPVVATVVHPKSCPQVSEASAAGLAPEARHSASPSISRPTASVASSYPSIRRDTTERRTDGRRRPCRSRSCRPSNSGRRRRRADTLGSDQLRRRSGRSSPPGRRGAPLRDRPARQRPRPSAGRDSTTHPRHVRSEAVTVVPDPSPGGIRSGPVQSGPVRSGPVRSGQDRASPRGGDARSGRVRTVRPILMYRSR